MRCSCCKLLLQGGSCLSIKKEYAVFTSHKWVLIDSLLLISLQPVLVLYYSQSMKQSSQNEYVTSHFIIDVLQRCIKTEEVFFCNRLHLLDMYIGKRANILV